MQDLKKSMPKKAKKSMTKEKKSLNLFRYSPCFVMHLMLSKHLFSGPLNDLVIYIIYDINPYLSVRVLYKINH